MFDSQDAGSAEIGSRSGQRGPLHKTSIRLDVSYGVEIRLFDDLELLVVSRRSPGFVAGQSGVLRDLIRDIASGHIGPCKFLVFDLATGAGPGDPPPDFAPFVDELSNLIFQAPVLSVAWARQELAGPDLELALVCSMLVGEQDARLAFDMDLIDSLRTYSLLAHRIGFVQAERLMENSAVVSAAAAHDLMLVHSVVPPEKGVDGIRRFVQSRMRRHNSACGLYRAQRIAMTGAH